MYKRQLKGRKASSPNEFVRNFQVSSRQRACLTFYRTHVWIGATPAAMLVILLPVAASLLHIGTELEIDAGMGFYAPPSLFTGLVAPSGTKKSPMLRQILGPLLRLQAEANQDYDHEIAAYEVALRDEVSDVSLINDEESARIRKLIVAKTWPEKWDGTEHRGDE